jgi:transposase-like protein
VLENYQQEIIQHDRLAARRYYEDNPDASYREVAREVDRDNSVVTDWLKEDFDEGDDGEDEAEDTDDQRRKAVRALRASKRQ